MIRILELFGGIGACTQALKKLNIPIEIVDYVEIDKYAVKSFNAMNDTNFIPQDICEWNKKIDVDLIMHGSPCQDFSLAGKQAGGDKNSGTRSSLMYETLRIVNDLKPKYVIWENVKNIMSKKHIHNFNNYLEHMKNLGYTNYYKVLNAKDYGIPQNRERVFTISIMENKKFEFPCKQELKIKLKDLLEDKVDDKYYLSDKMVNYIQASNEKWTGNNHKSIINKTIASAINTGEGQRRCDASNYISDGLNDNHNIKIKNATRQGYQEAIDGDSVNLSYPKSKTRRGRVGKQISQTLQCTSNIGVVTNRNLKEKLCNYLISSNKVKENDVIRHSYSTARLNEWEKRNIEKNNEAPTLDTRCDGLGVVINQPPLRIRKLTPKECWRLMGFSDESYSKAAEINSNAQLYKQAGNSIVVNVLEEILRKLLLDNEE